MKRRSFAMVVAVLILAAILAGGGTEACAAGKAAKQKVGQDKISMSFSGAPVGFILQSLGRLYGVNFSIADGAAKNVVSLELKDVLFEDALKMIQDVARIEIVQVKPKSYVVREKTEDKLTEDEAKLAAKERSMKNAVVDTVMVKYAEVKDVETALKGVFGDENKDLFKISRLNADDTRDYCQLVVYASNESVMKTVKGLIQKLDSPRPLVEIEATFLEISLTGSKQSGLKWDMGSTIKFQEQLGTTTRYNPQTGEVISSTTDTLYPNNGLNALGRLTPFGLEFNFVSPSVGAGRVRVLNNPKIRVMSGRTAKLTSTTDTPYYTTDTDDNVTTEFKSTGTTLEIRPVVLDDGMIQLKVKPNVSDITGSLPSPDGKTTTPVTAERSTESVILLKPNETMVISGLMRDKQDVSETRVPVLSKLPLLGDLFKSTTRLNERTTTIVLIRPKLVDPNRPDEIQPGESLADLWKKALLGSSAVPPKDFTAPVPGKPADQGILPAQPPEVQEPAVQPSAAEKPANKEDARKKPAASGLPPIE